MHAFGTPIALGFFSLVLMSGCAGSRPVLSDSESTEVTQAPGIRTPLSVLPGFRITPLELKSAAVSWKRVDALVADDNLIYLATDEGLQELKISKAQVVSIRTLVPQASLARMSVHDLAIGPEATLWLAADRSVYRFNPKTRALDKMVAQVVPETQKLLDSFHSIAFSSDSKLLISVGAHEKECETQAFEKGEFRCRIGDGGKGGEGALGAVLSYELNLDTLKPTRKIEAFAYGLSSPRWLEPHRNGFLQIDDTDVTGAEESPELNFVTAGGHYGWPYCFGAVRKTRTWKESQAPYKCAEFQIPVLSLSPRERTLGLVSFSYQPSPAWPAWTTDSVFSSQGNRIVTFKKGPGQIPLGGPLEFITPAEPKFFQPRQIGATEEGLVFFEGVTRRLYFVRYDPKADYSLGSARPHLSPTDFDWIYR